MFKTLNAHDVALRPITTHRASGHSMLRIRPASQQTATAVDLRSASIVEDFVKLTPRPLALHSGPLDVALAGGDTGRF